MALLQAVAKNTAIQFIGKFITILLGLITFALIQRALLPEGYGRFTTIMAYTGFFSVVADLGLYLILIRELNQPNADRHRVYANVLGLRLVSCLIVFCAALLVLPFMNYSSLIDRGIAIAFISFLAVAVTQLTVSIFQTQLKMHWVALAEIIGRVVLLSWVILALQFNWGLLFMVVGVALGAFANMILLLGRAGKFVRIRVAFERAYWRYLLRETAPLAVSVTLNLLYFRLDTVILSLQRSASEVGLYGAAYKILETLNTFPIIFVGLLLPILTQTFANDLARFRQVYQQSFQILLAAVVPLIVGGWFLAEPIIRLVSGGEFIGAAPVLRLLLIGVGCLFLNSLSGHTITIIRKQRKMVWGYLAIAAVGVTLYLTLIPRFGMTGAAIGTITCEALSFIIGSWIVLRTAQFRLLFSPVWRIALAAGAMALTLWLIPGANLLVELIAGVVVYGVAALATGAIPMSLLRRLRERPESSGTDVPTPLA